MYVSVVGWWRAGAEWHDPELWWWDLQLLCAPGIRADAESRTGRQEKAAGNVRSLVYPIPPILNQNSKDSKHIFILKDKQSWRVTNECGTTLDELLNSTGIRGKNEFDGVETKWRATSLFSLSPLQTIAIGDLIERSTHGFARSPQKAGFSSFLQWWPADTIVMCARTTFRAAAASLKCRPRMYKYNTHVVRYYIKRVGTTSSRQLVILLIVIQFFLPQTKITDARKQQTKNRLHPIIGSDVLSYPLRLSTGQGRFDFSTKVVLLITSWIALVTNKVIIQVLYSTIPSIPVGRVDFRERCRRADRHAGKSGGMPTTDWAVRRRRWLFWAVELVPGMLSGWWRLAQRWHCWIA